MTYSFEHATEADHLMARLDMLDRAMSELRQMIAIYGDAMDLPGRRPAVDPERTGRQATHGPSRPTEDAALDEARTLMKAEQHQGTTYVTHAIACVRGATAGMDRALAFWEGEPQGGGNERACTDGAAEHESG